jgi:hypothetical protein
LKGDGNQNIYSNLNFFKSFMAQHDGWYGATDKFERSGNGPNFENVYFQCFSLQKLECPVILGNLKP